MTKRTITIVSLSAATAAFMLSERSAFSSDTLWDLLRAGDPTRKRVAPAPTNTAPTPYAIPAQPVRVFAAAQPTGLTPLGDATTPTMWDLLRAGDPAKKRVAATPLKAQPPVYIPTTQLPASVSAEPAGLAPPARTVQTFSMWDLLRAGDPGRAAAGGGAPLTIAQAVQAAQPDIDPKTGAPIQPKVKKPRTGVVGFFDSVGQTFRKVGKMLNSDIKIQGQKSVGVHMESVSGSTDAYSSDTFYGRRGFGGMYNQTDLTIQGKLAGIINFETRYSDNPYGNPYDNRLSLNYATKHLKIDAGDINGSITGNSLIDFSRTLQGVQVSGDVMRGLKLTTLLSQTKAQARTITLPGGNGPGPYWVYAGQIVDGSERVRINNREMTKGDDYTLDPYTGELRFKPGTIIHPEDVIAVTFETYGYNQSPGVLTGFRGDLDLFKGAKMGVAWLSQLTKANRSTTATKTDQFQGYDNPLTPYTLDFPVEVIILKKDANGQPTDWVTKYPMQVTVGGTPQFWKTDFVVDPLLPNRVYFSHPVPSTTLVRITYVPRVDNETPGNRSVMGMDAFFPIGKMGTVAAEFATSKLDLSGNNIAGAAWQLRGDMKFLKDRLHWNWNLRDINPNFTAIESPGFRRNEAGLTMGFDYLAAKNVKLTFNMENSARPAYDYGSITNSSSYAQAKGRDNFNQLNFGVAWQLGKGGQFSLQHNALNTQLSAGGKTGFLTDNINFSYAFKSFDVGMTFGRNSNQSVLTTLATGTNTTGSTFNAYNSDSLTERLNLRWRASERLSFAAIVASSKVNGTLGRNTNAQDMQLTTEFKPLKSMRLSVGYAVQDSGTSSFFGTQNGTTGNTSGTGSNGNVLAPTRQILGGGTGGIGGIGYGSGYGGGTGGMNSTFGGFGSYNGYGYGGGYNSNLGGYGNYSGGLYSGGYSGFGITSFGGKSKTMNVAFNYQPWQALNLDLTWNSATSQGDYQFNSHRNDLGMNVTYNMGEKLSLSTAFTTQKVSYIGTQGGTSSNLMFFNVRAKPLGRLVTNLNYSIMKTNSALNLTNTTGGSTTGQTGGFPGGLTGGYGGGYGGGYYGGGTGGLGGGTGGLGGGYGGGGYYGGGGFGGATNLNSYSLRLEYPIYRSNNLYFQFDNATSAGYLASDQRTMLMGIDFALTGNTRFTLGWRNQQHVLKGDTTSAYGNYSYRVNSVDADLNLRF